MDNDYDNWQVYFFQEFSKLNKDELNSNEFAIQQRFYARDRPDYNISGGYHKIRIMSRLLLLVMCVFLSKAYMIDQNNYFYINSSYSRQTASISMCFHFSQPAALTFQSPLLNGNAQGVILAEFNDENSIQFTPTFDPDMVGYNNFDSGQYWFGVKLPQKDNQKQDTFQKLKLKIRIGQQEYEYVFLSPLYKLMLNAFEVSPRNTLYSYEDWMLISYLYREGEVDAFIFETRGAGGYKLKEQGDWGFKREDTEVNYQRYKSKKSNRMTLQIWKTTSKEMIILEPQDLPNNSLTLASETFSFTLQDLRKVAVPLGSPSSEL